MVAIVMFMMPMVEIMVLVVATISLAMIQVDWALGVGCDGGGRDGS